MGLHYDIRDVSLAVRLGWSGKKIWIGLMGLLLAYVGYSALVLVAHLTAGHAVSALWHHYGLFIGARWGEFGLLGAGLHVLGMVWVIVVLLIVLCMMCKITYHQLRGDDFYGSGDAWFFVKKHGASVLCGPIAVLALFVFFVVSGILLGLVCGWVPVIGEWVFALSFVPIFFLSLMAVFAGVVFFVSIMLSPAIVGTVGEDALEVVIQSFSLAWSQPWRLLLYGLWMKVGVWVGVFLICAVSILAMGLMTWACGLFMDVKLANMFDVALRYLPLRRPYWDVVLANLPSPDMPSWSERVGGQVLGGMLMGIMSMILAYALAVYASGISLIYVVLRKYKDDEILLARDLVGEDVMPPFVETISDQHPVVEETHDDTSDSKTT